MKAIQAVKKMVALGMGLTMVGATIFGASAAKLSDWPAPFVVNGTPASNLAIVVGDQADGSDVVGAIDIIQALQAGAVQKVAAPGTPSQLVVEGDAVEIGSTSDLLEIGEKIGDVRETLTEVDLDMLKGGQIVTDKGSTEFNQYLRFSRPGQDATDAGVIPNAPKRSGSVIFAKDERDRVGHYLFFKTGDRVFQWELEFESGLKSRIEGNDLVDLEDEDVTVLGQPFVVVDTDLINHSDITATNGTPDLTIQLIGGAVSAVLGENDKETYVVDGKEYEVEVLVISETSHGGDGSVKFRINGEITDELTDGETDVLADGTQIGIRDILATGKDIQKSIVQFYIGAYKVEFKDANTADSQAQVAGTQVNEETIEDSNVTIKGQFSRNPTSGVGNVLTGAEYTLSSVTYDLFADSVLGDLYVAPGHGVREQLDEPEGMLTPNWDITYQGLMDTGVTLVRLDAKGDDEYDLEFTNQEGIFFDVPFMSNEVGNENNGMLKYGDNDDNFWFTEFDLFNIQRHDFFKVENCDIAANDDTCFTHVLRFDSIDTTNRQLTFTDLGTGTREVTYDPTGAFNLNVGGVTYIGLVNLGDNATIRVDLNGNGSIDNCSVDDIFIQGEGILRLGFQAYPGTTTNNSSVPANASCAAQINTTNFSIETLQKEFDEATTDEIINMVIEARSNNEIGIQRSSVRANSGIFYGLFQLEENDDLSQGLSGYGVFLELFDPHSSNQAEDATVEYPLSERGARVFVTGGVVTTSKVDAGGSEKVQPIQIGAAKLASEIKDITQFNAVVVGGPCANTVAATLLGNPEKCYDTVPENKAIVKLFEHTNGNVALLINGRSAVNTRMASRAVATGQIAKATGTEAEVTGTSLTDVEVKAV